MVRIHPDAMITARRPEWSTGGSPSETRPAWRDAVIVGDAIEVLARLPASSVHLAVTSPPYNVGIRYSGYADDRSQPTYLAWLKRVWQELYETLVPGGRLALNVAPTSIKDFHPLHHDLSSGLRDLGFIMRTEIIWYKQTMGRRTAWGSWRSPANPHIIPSWEYVLVFSKRDWKLAGDRSAIDITGEEFQRYSDGHWRIPPETRRKGHPAPFPEELIRRLIKFYTYRGNVVLDMFGGTGTVAAVAKSLGRHFVHIDASREYCEQALLRVRSSRSPRGVYAVPSPSSLTTVEALGLLPRAAPTARSRPSGAAAPRTRSEGVAQG